MIDKYYDEVRKNLIAAGFADAGQLSDDRIATALLHYMRETGLTFTVVKKAGEEVAKESAEGRVDAVAAELERILNGRLRHG